MGDLHPHLGAIDGSQDHTGVRINNFLRLVRENIEPHPDLHAGVSPYVQGHFAVVKDASNLPLSIDSSIKG